MQEGEGRGGEGWRVNQRSERLIEGRESWG